MSNGYFKTCIRIEKKEVGIAVLLMCFSAMILRVKKLMLLHVTRLELLLL